MGVTAYLIDPPLAQGEEAVFDALLALGGSAHIDVIVGQVEYQRRQSGLLGGPPARMIVETALHDMCEPHDMADGCGKGRVYRPFGPSSLRWAVCRDATRRPTSVLQFETVRRYER